MPDTSLSSSVNQHYLEKVMHLAEEMPVVATEDIFDARGMKLLAKGAQVSRGLQEKLILHKLKKPLESSICVEGGVDANLIVATATRILEQNPAVARIVEASNGAGASPLKILAPLEFGNAMTMMLTISERAGTSALDHAVTVALLSICMTRKCGLSLDDQSTAALAGLLHDVGELYIDPAFMAPGKRLLPHEWAHIVVHPRVGQMLIDELEAYPKAVGQAVAEHHERYNGSGYPRASAGRAISAVGQAISVAEMIAAVLDRDHPLERAELALKIVPGEHAHILLSAISGAMQSPAARSESAASAPPQPCEDVAHLFWRITLILAAAKALLAAPTTVLPATRALLGVTLERVEAIQRAATSTGLDFYLGQQNSFDASADAMLVFEKDVATREIQWRLRAIARDLALYSASAAERAALAPLINLLDDDRSAPASGQLVLNDGARSAPLQAAA